ARAVSEEAMERLHAYPWPGNVRELFHVLERAAVLCASEVIDVHDLPSLPAPAGALAAAARGPDDLSLHAAVARLEKEFIPRALPRAGANRAAAARLLGIGRPQLYAKMEEHGLGGRAAAEPDDDKS